MTIQAILDLHVFSSAALFGLIWTVQLVLYPAFLFVDKSKSHAFHQMHTARISIVVAPLMILELLTAVALYYLNENLIHALNLFLVAAVWFCTFFISVPLHNKLAASFEEKTVRKLIATNWPRTVFWSLKVALLYFM